MSFSSDRGQTEPLAALIAVFALGVGLSIYVGVLDTTVPMLTDDADMTPTAADALVNEASSFGTVQPPLGDAVEAARPKGYGMNATLTTRDGAWSGGSTSPSEIHCGTRTVSVQTAPGVVRPGTLEVCLWPER